MSEKKVVQRIPFHWAVAITVVIALIPGLFLGKWNFALWISFIAWAEYFVFGATTKAGKLILPGFALGAFSAALWMANWVWFEKLFKTNFSSNLWMFVLLSVTNLIWVTLLVYIIAKNELMGQASLACFNGLSMFLAVYFTTLGGAKNALPQVGPLNNPYWLILLAFLWTTAMGWFGYILAIINMWLTFPKEVDA